jgi:hypothetical protein
MKSNKIWYVASIYTVAHIGVGVGHVTCIFWSRDLHKYAKYGKICKILYHLGLFLTKNYKKHSICLNNIVVQIHSCVFCLNFDQSQTCKMITWLDNLIGNQRFVLMRAGHKTLDQVLLENLVKHLHTLRLPILKTFWWNPTKFCMLLLYIL